MRPWLRIINVYLVRLSRSDYGRFFLLTHRSFWENYVDHEIICFYRSTIKPLVLSCPTILLIHFRIWMLHSLFPRLFETSREHSFILMSHALVIRERERERGSLLSRNKRSPCFSREVAGWIIFSIWKMMFFRISVQVISGRGKQTSQSVKRSLSNLGLFYNM